MLRFLAEKAQTLATGESAPSEEAYHTIISTIADLDDAVAKRLLFQAILMATAGIRVESIYTGQDALKILDGLSIASDGYPS